MLRKEISEELKYGVSYSQDFSRKKKKMLIEDLSRLVESFGYKNGEDFHIEERGPLFRIEKISRETDLDQKQILKKLKLKKGEEIDHLHFKIITRNDFRKTKKTVLQRYKDFGFTKGVKDGLIIGSIGFLPIIVEVESKEKFLKGEKILG